MRFEFAEDPTCPDNFSVRSLGGRSQSRKQESRGDRFLPGRRTADAAVQLEDEVTLQVMSSITDRDGRFHFTGLNPDRDYQVRATKKGYWSNAHSISKFSSRAVETVHLELRPGKEK